MGFNSAAAVKNSRGMSKLSKVRRSVPETVWPWLRFRFDGVRVTYTRRRFRGDRDPNRLQPQVPTGGIVQTYARRRGAEAPDFLSSVRENLAAEGLEQLAQSQVVDKKKTKTGAVKGDDELSKLTEVARIANEDLMIDEDLTIGEELTIGEALMRNPRKNVL